MLRRLAPRHRLGQNFLIDLNLMRKVVEAAGPQPGDLLLEVGPGTGSLSEHLLDSGAELIAVELDRGLAELLRNRFADNPRFTLIEGDALAGKHHLNVELLETWRSRIAARPGTGRLIANLPYQIATPLLIELLVQVPEMTTLTCTIQKEVGVRLMADPGGRDYGPISVVAQTLAEVHRVATLPPQAFWPRPKVDSVALHMARRSELPFPLERAGGFALLLQQAFMQRRKMLRAGLKPILGDDTVAILEQVGIDPTARCESLPPSVWQQLYLALPSSH